MKMVLKGCLACEKKHEDEWFVDCNCICHDYAKKVKDLSDLGENYA